MFSDHLKNIYAQSKWIAEKLIYKADHSGLLVVIQRLESIGVNTETDACNPNDINTLLLTTVLKIGYCSETMIYSTLNGLSVNVAVQKIVFLNHSHIETYVKIHHIVNKQGKNSQQYSSM